MRPGKLSYDFSTQCPRLSIGQCTAVQWGAVDFDVFVVTCDVMPRIAEAGTAGVRNGRLVQCDGALVSGLG